MVTYEYDPEEDIYILQGDLPEGVDGFCKEIDCYEYAVVDFYMAEEMKRKILEHEYRHLKNHDLQRDFDELSVL